MHIKIEIWFIIKNMKKKISILWLFLALLVILLEFFVIYNRHRFFWEKRETEEIVQAFYRQNETIKDILSVTYYGFECDLPIDNYVGCGITGEINKISGEVNPGASFVICKYVENEWDCPLNREKRKEYILSAPEQIIAREIKDHLYPKP